MSAIALARILVVDDAVAHVEALCDTLRDRGYEVAGFSNASDALQALHAGQFDLLLTDLQMPGMDGVELLTAALRIDPQLVGILMTGKGTIETAVQAMQAGALDYVLKPISMNDLLPTITRSLDIRRLRLENLELRNTLELHELNQAIANTFDSGVLLEKIAAAALAQFEGDEASVMLLSDDGQFLHVAAAVGAGREALIGARQPVGDGLAGWVATRREPLMLEGEIKDPNLAPLFPRADIQSALSMPMMASNQLIGVLNVNCVRKRRGFSFGQVKVLSIFTNAAAAAIQAVRLHEAQRRAEARFREVLEMAPDGVVSIDEEQRIVIFNAAAERLFGYSFEEVRGRPLDILLPPELVAKHRDHVQAFGEGHEQSRSMAGRTNLHGRRKDGTLFYAAVGISKRSENHRLLYTAVVCDVTLRVQQEARIARLSRTRAVLSAINSAIVRIHDRGQLFREACRIAVEEGEFRMAWIGVAEPDLGKVRPVAWMGTDAGYLDEVGLKLKSVAQDLGAGGRALRERRPIIVNDIESDQRVVFRKEALARDYHSFVVLPLMVDDKPVGVIALYSGDRNSFDVEEMKLLSELAGDVSFALQVMEKEELLFFRAHHDVLTGLPNRSHLVGQVDQRVRESGDARGLFAVILFDIERFRNINETLGRHVGDAILRELALRLGNSTGGVDLLARVGADQFAVATGRAEQDEANIARFIEAIAATVFERPFDVGDSTLQLAARAGIAVYPGDGADAESLYRNAEAALRSAKQAGETYKFYASHMNATVAETLQMESRLRGALRRNEFVLHYQPKLDLVSGVIVGLEALLRWQDPELGLVPPMRFIPLLEETGLIVEAGSWVMQEAVRAGMALRAMGLPSHRIAVNISPIQLRHPSFVQSVEAAIAVAGSEPHGLDLEVTESVLMQDIEVNVAKLKQVKELGVELAIDDFGTGYSSLAYIGRLPVGTIKIDRTFIRNLKEDADSMSIVQTIISLTHALNRKVVAEGVETEEQAQLLRLLRCDQYQGYLFSKPVTLNDLEPLLHRSPVS